MLIKGTARSFSADVRDLLQRRLAEVADGIAKAGGCEAVSKYHRRYPALVNAVDQTKIAGAGRCADGRPRERRGERPADRRGGGLRLHAGEESPAPTS